MDKAVTDYKEEIRLDSSPDVHYFAGESHRGLGTVYLKKGQVDRAIDEFGEAIQMGTFGNDKWATVRSLGDAYRKKGDLRKAIDLYAEAVLFGGNDFPDKEISAYRELIQLDPKYAPLYCRRGNTYFKNGDIDKAITDFTEAIQLDPKVGDRWDPIGSPFGFDSVPRPA